MAWFLRLVINLISNPYAISITCSVFIVFYYLVSIGFVHNATVQSPSTVWRKNGFFDIVTSIVWMFVSTLLISSLFELAGTNGGLSLTYLILYYFFFIFLFGILYGLLEWHWPGMLVGLNASSWSGEVGFIILSIQTQTTLGYTRARPNRGLTEAIACVQALLGLFFCMLFISKAVSV